jgi:hypothetical protein
MREAAPLVNAPAMDMVAAMVIELQKPLFPTE